MVTVSYTIHEINLCSLIIPPLPMPIYLASYHLHKKKERIPQLIRSVSKFLINLHQYGFAGSLSLSLSLSLLILFSMITPGLSKVPNISTMIHDRRNSKNMQRRPSFCLQQQRTQIIKLALYGLYKQATVGQLTLVS
jgi:hypothetical protein